MQSTTFARSVAEREGIVLSRASVHRILQGAQMLPEPKRRQPQHRRRRKRYAQEGMLVQIDGSRHAWLGERGPWLTLIAAIDDATGKIIAGVFREQEDAHGYFLLVRQMLQRHGRPLALYHDRHGIFQQTSKATEADTLEEQLAGKQEPTQFGRLLEELEISSIAARSPQAKGRVERLFGTLQDRLVIELRLAGASTREQANEVLQAYLPRFNAQFAVEPAQGELAYRPLPETLCLDTIVCFKYVRTVALDNTVNFGEHRLQLLPDQQRRSYARAEVEVHERLDGSLAVCYAGRCLLTTTAPEEAPVLRARHGRQLQLKPVRVSSPHPHPESLFSRLLKGKVRRQLLSRRRAVALFLGRIIPGASHCSSQNRHRSVRMSAKALVQQHPTLFFFPSGARKTRPCDAQTCQGGFPFRVP